MRFGSVCSGIEAASVAWHPLGWQAAWFSEIEPFPCAVLAHHYPEVPNHGDMTALPQLIRSGKVEAPDLFCGGTPCQAFSVAGLRRSLDDERGNLSLTFVEIADAIDDVRRARGDAECIVFWENVPGVLSTQDNAFGCFLGALAGCDTAIEPLAATGWTDAGVVAGPVRTVAWRVLDAQYFGLAQRRRRVFVVASAREGFDPAAVLLEWEGLRRDSAPSREAGQRATGSLTARAGRNLGQANDDVDGHKLITMAHGQGGAEIGFDRGPPLTCNHEAPILAHALRGEGFDASEDGTGRGTPLVPVIAGTLKANNGGGGWSNSADHAAAGYMVPVAMRESGQGYWMQDDIAGTLRAEGEDRPSRPSHVIGVPVAFSSKDHGADATADLAPTLRAMPHHGSHANGGGQMAVAFDTYNQTISETAQTLCSRGDTPGGNAHLVPAVLAHAFDARQSDVLQYGDKTGPLDTDGHSVAVAVRTANTSANGHGISAELAHTLDQAQGQAVAIGFDSYNQMLTGDITQTIGTSLELNPKVLAPTLTATNDPSRSPQSNEITAQVAAITAAAMQVRRLTPVECERLQGFPDDYTAIPWRNKPASECPDGPRYKALGNSWAVPVVRWIGRRIAERIA